MDLVTASCTIHSRHIAHRIAHHIVSSQALARTRWERLPPPHHCHIPRPGAHLGLRWFSSSTFGEARLRIYLGREIATVDLPIRSVPSPFRACINCCTTGVCLDWLCHDSWATRISRWNKVMAESEVRHGERRLKVEVARAWAATHWYHHSALVHPQHSIAFRSNPVQVIVVRSHP